MLDLNSEIKEFRVKYLSLKITLSSPPPLPFRITLSPLRKWGVAASMKPTLLLLPTQGEDHFPFSLFCPSFSSSPPPPPPSPPLRSSDSEPLPTRKSLENRPGQFPRPVPEVGSRVSAWTRSWISLDLWAPTNGISFTFPSIWLSTIWMKPSTHPPTFPLFIWIFPFAPPTTPVLNSSTIPSMP